VTGEAPLRDTGHGLVAAGPGWFVLNARDARWRDRPGRGHNAPLTGYDDDEVEALFPKLGFNVIVLAPGEPVGMYHWEDEVEEFLVVSGEALLIVEGQERPLRRWDFVHCPPGTRHIIVGAGGGPCVIVAVGTREHLGEGWGAYTVDETAIRHGAGIGEQTDDANVAYAHLPPTRDTSYPGGLPGD
jgi:uncharacterized cupin superfamily protein